MPEIPYKPTPRYQSAVDEMIRDACDAAGVIDADDLEAFAMKTTEREQIEQLQRIMDAKRKFHEDVQRISVPQEFSILTVIRHANLESQFIFIDSDKAEQKFLELCDEYYDDSDDEDVDMPPDFIEQCLKDGFMANESIDAYVYLRSGVLVS